MDPCTLLRSRFRSTAATAIAAGVPVDDLIDDLDELAERILTTAPQRLNLTVVQ